jgi:multiple sugar transport system substrate-binding protein
MSKEDGMRIDGNGVSRRRLIGGALAGAAALLAACGPLPVPGAEKPTAEPPKPTAAPAKIGAAPATTAAAPTAGAAPAKTAAAPAAGATPAAAAPAAAVKPGEVRLLTHFARDGKSPREVALKEITDRFEAERPGVKITFEIIPWPDIPKKFMAGHEAGNAPDIIYASFERRFLSQGSALNLQPMVDNWKKDDLQDIVESVWNQTVVEGKQYGLPQPIFSHTIVYRKDLYEGTGLETTKPTTWDKFIEASKKAMRDGAGRKRGEAGFDDKAVKTWGFGHYKGREKGGSVAIERTMLEMGQTAIKPDSGEANWTNEAGYTSMAMWASMMKEHQIQPRSDLQASLDDGDNNFAGGVTASYLVGNHRYGSMRQNYTFPESNAGFIRMPTFKGEKYGPANVQTRGLALWSGTKVKDQVWSYGEFLVTPWSDLKMAIGGELIPIRKSVGASSEFKNLPPTHAHLKLLSEAVSEWGYSDLSAPVPYAPHVLLAYHRIVVENLPVEKAMQDAAAEYNKQVAESKKA